MAIPDGAPHDEYAITLKYKNKQTGEVKRLYRRKLSLARYRKLGICQLGSETDQRRI